MDSTPEERRCLKLKDLKQWLNMLPNDFLEYDLVTANNGILATGVHIYEKEFTIRGFDVDEAYKQILFLHATDESKRSQKIII